LFQGEPIYVPLRYDDKLHSTTDSEDPNGKYEVRHSHGRSVSTTSCSTL